MDTSVPDGQRYLPVRLFFFLPLQHLFHEVPHGGRRLVLLLPGCVDVGTQGESRIEAAQHRGYSFQVHSVLESRGGEGVPEIMEPEMPQPCIPQNFLMEVHQRIRVVHFPSEGGGER